MTISENTISKIVMKYGISLSELEDACNCINEILCVEADLTKDKNPYATNYIARIKSAAGELFCLGSDISNENFGT